MEREKTDSEIEQWVLRELGSEEKLRSPEICVQSHNGVVTLHGSVPDYANRLAAQHAAYRVVGIAGVVNDIRVKPRSAQTRKRSTPVVRPEPFSPNVLVPPIQVAKGAMP